MNIFERAARKKLRFTSIQGSLSSEQLFDLELTALDKIARAVNNSLKLVSEESFIAVKPHPDVATNNLQLDILKHVIAVKMKSVEAAAAKVERDDKRKKLIDALAVKEGETLAGKTQKELLKELNKLDK